MDRGQLKRRKVLIVERDAKLRLLMKTVLEESGLDITECDSGEAALATMLLRGQEIAMIFADVQLSGVMDGIDLAQEVKMRSTSRCDSNVGKCKRAPRPSTARCGVHA
jgi:CheY-like chemotaxis protein